MGRLGLCLVLILLVAAVFGPWLAPFDPFLIDVSAKFQPPSFPHLLGTDNLGRDILSRLIAGSWIAMGVGMSTVLVALVLGLILGLIAGYGPLWLDYLLMLVLDAIYAVPTVVMGSPAWRWWSGSG